MFSLDRVEGLIQRLPAYSPWVVAVELILIGVVVYAVVRFVEGTRAAGALKGLLVLVVVLGLFSRLLDQGGTFQRLSLLYDRFLALVAISLVIIFQPELRRALVRLSEIPFFRSTPREIAEVVGDIAEAAKYLSRMKYGGLIVIERQVGLAGIVEGGTVLNADLSAPLLQSVFYPGSALHDLAVVIKGKRVHSAGVQLPLAEPGDMPDARLGSRHRAAVGVSKECDALVVVVSEETGAIRIAERGRLTQPLSVEELTDELESRLTTSMRTARRAAVGGGGVVGGAAGGGVGSAGLAGADGVGIVGEAGPMGATDGEGFGPVDAPVALHDSERQSEIDRLASESRLMDDDPRDADDGRGGRAAG